MNEHIVAPSVLSLDYTHLKEQVRGLNESNAKWLHFDVMDGHFVPNITFGPIILHTFDQMSDLFMDVHLMISDPEKYIPDFIKAGADGITFHTEAVGNDIEHIRKIIDDLHAQSIKAGFVVKPKTDIKQFEPLLPIVDYILIMSVEPGFGGQKFMPDQLDKVRWLDAKRQEKGLSFRIEIDGGINETTAKEAYAAGCDTLVAGSYVFKADIAKQVDSIL
ncbi:MAG: ribulose-phosphate 3-epimerase [Catenisphaera adipataccumulans]|jgi:ribulose-phosphate 3-epimerase|uniref:ribulose-phosphate 3-epimerase n=1 Tax=Catenisphaera adipataccumulans TaxID=700500 RepID=UPI003D9441BC